MSAKPPFPIELEQKDKELDETYIRRLRTEIMRLRDERAGPAWRSIDSAPKHTEVLVWREDSGPFIAQLMVLEQVIIEEEMEREKLSFPDDFEEWYSAAYGWQEGSEKPTHWMPLPEGPSSGATEGDGK